MEIMFEKQKALVKKKEIILSKFVHSKFNQTTLQIFTVYQKIS